jgi:putative hydrolase
MISVKTDPHTHTLFSGHAFSTIEENVLHAKEQGMEAIAMTDHFGLGYKPGDSLSAGPSLNMPALPKVCHGIRVLAGTEIDIIDFDGNLAGQDVLSFDGKRSYADMMLDTMDVAIASVHQFKGFKDGTVAQNTKLFVTVVQNPKIDIIGHPGRSGLPFDIDEVLLAAKDAGCLIEINEHSLDFAEPVLAVCHNIAIRCAELDVPVAVSSDAHSSFDVGKFDKALTMLDEIGFPEHLVANTTLERLLKHIARVHHVR